MIKKTTIASILCGLIMQSCMPYKQFINNDDLCSFDAVTGAVAICSIFSPCFYDVFENNIPASRQ